MLRDGDECSYVDEEAIAPLWKGRRFPLTSCISGWVMEHRQAAAISDIGLNGLDRSILIPLVIGSVPGSILGSHIAPRVPQSYIRRGIVVVLTMSGLALLDKAGWAPLGSGEDDTHPLLVAIVGLVLLAAVPFVWGLLRRQLGMPMFGTPTVAEIEEREAGTPPGAEGEPAAPPVRAD